ncbi:MAG: PAS domain S-box protein, partial [Candidatus Zixiibacteriota bacterium]
MKKTRASQRRYSLFGLFLVLPFLFLAWIIGVNLSVLEQQDTVRSCLELEDRLAELEHRIGLLAQSVATTETGNIDLVSLEQWRRIYSEYMAARSALDLERSVARPLMPYIVKTDSLVAALNQLYLDLAESESHTALSGVSGDDWAALHREAEHNIHQAAHICATRSGSALSDLWSGRKGLIIVVWGVCLLAFGLAAMLMVYHRNLLKSRKAEAALRESEERYRWLVELSPQAIVVHVDGRTVYVNQAAVELYGAKSAEEEIGRPIYDFVHPDYHDVIRERARQLYSDRKATEPFEIKMVRADGKVIEGEV